jgi:hypothetical protein
MTATRNERIPAMTAAARASERVCGPSVARPAAVDDSPAMRMTERVDSTAASAQTMVETSLGEMEESRASEGFVAHALTVLPIMVRSRNQMRRSTLTGTRIKTPRSAPRMLTPATVQVPLMALG